MYHINLGVPQSRKQILKVIKEQNRELSNFISETIEKVRTDSEDETDGDETDFGFQEQAPEVGMEGPLEESEYEEEEMMLGDREWDY